MRRVIGKQVEEMPDADFQRLRERYGGLLLDVGAGDGKHAYQLARQRPDWLVVGLDANRDNLRRSAARAVAKPARGGLANLLYVWAAAEQLPAGLSQVDEMHVLMPWGSLLRGLLGADDQLLVNLARAGRPGATFLVTLNLHAWRPPVPEVGGSPEPSPSWARAELTPRYAGAGWLLADASYLDAGQIAALGTSWTRRLSASRAGMDVLALTGTLEPARDRFSDLA